jgi:hypothetical protein
MKNTLSHIYLYAKGHYERKDIIEDLKIIVAQICGTSPEHISKNDICYWLTRQAFRHMNEQFGDPLTAFRDFIFDLDPANCWKVGYPTKKGKWPAIANPYDFELAVIYKCLSIIRMTSILGNDGKTVLIELDEPDSTLLPLHKKG